MMTHIEICQHIVANTLVTIPDDIDLNTTANLDEHVENLPALGKGKALTPLMWAIISNCNLDLITQILIRDLDVNVVSPENGWTALHYLSAVSGAAIKQASTVFNLLKGKGANLQHEDNDHKKFYQYPHFSTVSIPIAEASRGALPHLNHDIAFQIPERILYVENGALLDKYADKLSGNWWHDFFHMLLKKYNKPNAILDHVAGTRLRFVETLPKVEDKLKSDYFVLEKEKKIFYLKQDGDYEPVSIASFEKFIGDIKQLNPRFKEGDLLPLNTYFAITGPMRDVLFVQNGGHVRHDRVYNANQINNEAFIRDLQLNYAYLAGIIATEAKATPEDVLLNLIDGMSACTQGFITRAADLKQQLATPLSLHELLYFVRREQVRWLQSHITSNIHARGVMYTAASVGMAIAPLNNDEINSGVNIENYSRYLLAFFNQDYRLYTLTAKIREFLIGILHKDVYIGAKKTYPREIVYLPDHYRPTESEKAGWVGKYVYQKKCFMRKQKLTYLYPDNRTHSGFNISFDKFEAALDIPKGGIKKKPIVIPISAELIHEHIIQQGYPLEFECYHYAQMMKCLKQIFAILQISPEVYGDIIQYTVDPDLDAFTFSDINWQLIEKLIHQKIIQENIFSSKLSIFRSHNNIDMRVESDLDAIDFFRAQNMDTISFKFFITEYLAHLVQNRELFLNRVLYYQCESNQIDRVKLLLELGANAEFVFKEYRNFDDKAVGSFYETVRSIFPKPEPKPHVPNPNPPPVVEKIVKPKIKPFNPDHDYSTDWFLEVPVLNKAVLTRNPELVQLLLQSIKNIPRTSHHLHALHELAFKTRNPCERTKRIMQMLYNKGLKLTDKINDKRGTKPADLARNEFRQALFSMELNEAVQLGNIEEIAPIIARGATIDGRQQQASKQFRPSDEQIIKRAQEKFAAVEKLVAEQTHEIVTEEEGFYRQVNELLQTVWLAQGKVLLGYVAPEHFTDIHKLILTLLIYIHKRYPIYGATSLNNMTCPDNFVLQTDTIFQDLKFNADSQLTEPALNTVVSYLNKEYNDDLSCELHTHAIHYKTSSTNNSVTIHNTDGQYFLIREAHDVYSDKEIAFELIKQVQFNGGIIKAIILSRLQTQFQPGSDEVWDLSLIPHDKLLHFLKDECEIIKTLKNFAALTPFIALDVSREIFAKIAELERETNLTAGFYNFCETYMQTCRLLITQELLNRQEANNELLQDDPLKIIEEKIRLQKELLQQTQDTLSEHTNNVTTQTQDVRTITEDLALLESSVNKQKMDIENRLATLNNQIPELQAAVTAAKKQHDEATAKSIKSQQEEKDNAEGLVKLNAQKTLLTSTYEKLNHEILEIKAKKSQLTADTKIITVKELALQKEKQEANDKLSLQRACLSYVHTIKERFSAKIFTIAQMKSICAHLLSIKALDTDRFVHLYHYIASLIPDCVNPLILERASQAEEYLSECIDIIKAVLSTSSQYKERVFRFSAHNLYSSDAAHAFFAELNNQLTQYGLYLDDDLVLCVKKDVVALRSLPSKLQEIIIDKFRAIEPPKLYAIAEDEAEWDAINANNGKTMIEKCHLTRDEILPGLFERVEYIAARDIVINEAIHLPGIDFVCRALNNITIEKEVVINTSSFDAPVFTHPTARDGSQYRKDDKPEGRDGDWGLCGNAAFDAGNILISAQEKIVNIDNLECIANGGKGAWGQKGGNGDQGAPGLDTPSARPDECEETGFFDSGTSQTNLATARIPGVRPNGSRARDEVSQTGGEPGVWGYGGKGGNAGQIVIDSKMVERCKRMSAKPGLPGEDAVNDAKYGLPGEAGRIGFATANIKSGEIKWFTTKWKFKTVHGPFDIKAFDKRMQDVHKKYDTDNYSEQSSTVWYSNHIDELEQKDRVKSQNERSRASDRSSEKTNRRHNEKRRNEKIKHENVLLTENFQSFLDNHAHTLNKIKALSDMQQKADKTISALENGIASFDGQLTLLAASKATFENELVQVSQMETQKNSEYETVALQIQSIDQQIQGAIEASGALQAEIAQQLNLVSQQDAALNEASNRLQHAAITLTATQNILAKFDNHTRQVMNSLVQKLHAEEQSLKLVQNVHTSLSAKLADELKELQNLEEEYAQTAKRKNQLQAEAKELADVIAEVSTLNTEKMQATNEKAIETEHLILQPGNSSSQESITHILPQVNLKQDEIELEIKAVCGKLKLVINEMNIEAILAGLAECSQDCDIDLVSQLVSLIIQWVEKKELVSVQQAVALMATIEKAVISFALIKSDILQKQLTILVQQLIGHTWEVIFKSPQLKELPPKQLAEIRAKLKLHFVSGAVKNNVSTTCILNYAKNYFELNFQPGIQLGFDLLQLPKPYNYTDKDISEFILSMSAQLAHYKITTENKDLSRIVIELTTACLKNNTPGTWELYESSLAQNKFNAKNEAVVILRQFYIQQYLLHSSKYFPLKIKELKSKPDDCADRVICFAQYSPADGIVTGIQAANLTAVEMCNLIKSLLQKDVDKKHYLLIEAILLKIDISGFDPSDLISQICQTYNIKFETVIANYYTFWQSVIVNSFNSNEVIISNMTALAMHLPHALKIQYLIKLQAISKTADHAALLEHQGWLIQSLKNLIKQDHQEIDDEHDFYQQAMSRIDFKHELKAKTQIAILHDLLVTDTDKKISVDELEALYHLLENKLIESGGDQALKICLPELYKLSQVIQSLYIAKFHVAIQSAKLKFTDDTKQKDTIERTVNRLALNDNKEFVQVIVRKCLDQNIDLVSLKSVDELITAYNAKAQPKLKSFNLFDIGDIAGNEELTKIIQRCKDHFASNHKEAIKSWLELLNIFIADIHKGLQAWMIPFIHDSLSLIKNVIVTNIDDQQQMFDVSKQLYALINNLGSIDSETVSVLDNFAEHLAAYAYHIDLYRKVSVIKEDFDQSCSTNKRDVIINYLQSEFTTQWRTLLNLKHLSGQSCQALMSECSKLFEQLIQSPERCVTQLQQLLFKHKTEFLIDYQDLNQEFIIQLDKIDYTQRTASARQAYCRLSLLILTQSERIDMTRCYEQILKKHGEVADYFHQSYLLLLLQHMNAITSRNIQAYAESNQNPRLRNFNEGLMKSSAEATPEVSTILMNLHKEKEHAINDQQIESWAQTVTQGQDTFDEALSKFVSDDLINEIAQNSNQLNLLLLLLPLHSKQLAITRHLITLLSKHYESISQTNSELLISLQINLIHQQLATSNYSGTIRELVATFVNNIQIKFVETKDTKLLSQLSSLSASLDQHVMPDALFAAIQPELYLCLLTSQEAAFFPYLSDESKNSFMKAHFETGFSQALKKHYWEMVLCTKLFAPLADKYKDKPFADIPEWKTSFRSFLFTDDIDQVKRFERTMIARSDDQNLLSEMNQVVLLKTVLLKSFSYAFEKGTVSSWLKVIERLMTYVEAGLPIKQVNKFIEILPYFNHPLHMAVLLKDDQENLLNKIYQACLSELITKNLSLNKQHVLLTPKLLAHDELLYALIVAISDVHDSQLKTITIPRFNEILQILDQLPLNSDANFVAQLSRQPFIFWPVLLRRRQIEVALNLNTDTVSIQIVDNLIALSDVMTATDFQTIMSILTRQAGLQSSILNSCLIEFVSMNWQLDAAALNVMSQNTPDCWYEKLKAVHDKQAQVNDLTLQQLIFEMKSASDVGNGVLSEFLQDDNTPGSFSQIIKHAREQFVQLKDEYSKKPVKAGTIAFAKRVKIFPTSNAYLQSYNAKEASEVLAWVLLAVYDLSEHRILIRDSQLLAILGFLSGINSTNTRGRLANIYTSEGKTLITAVLALICALRQEIVDVVTSTRVLAERDANVARILFAYFDVSVDNICDQECENSLTERKRRYANNKVLYGHASVFQSDILLVEYQGQTDIRPRCSNRLIVDEADNMLLDNAAQSLYLSHKIGDFKHLRLVFVMIWQWVQDSPDLNDANLQQINAVYQLFKESVDNNVVVIPKFLENYVVEDRVKLWIKNAIRAKHMTEKVHYSIFTKDVTHNEITINELATGVEFVSGHWSNGLHQFLQLKHSKELSDETLRAVFISNFTYFNRYSQRAALFGMTGTLGSKLEQEIISDVYSVDLFSVPRFKRRRFRQDAGLVAADPQTWLAKIGDRVKQQTLNDDVPQGAILIICADKLHVELIYNDIAARFATELKNEQCHLHRYDSSFSELKLKDNKVQDGDIIIATNISGRGTDLELTESCATERGLYTLMTYVPDNLRIEEQALARSARKGQIGAGGFIVFDERASNSLITLQHLRDEKKVYEQDKLAKFVGKNLVQLKIEKELLELFQTFAQSVLEHLKKYNGNDAFIEIQQQGLLDAWAYFFASIQDKLESAYVPGVKEQLITQFEHFKAEQQNLFDHHIDMFIQGPDALMRLARHYSYENRYLDAQRCYESVIAQDARFSAFAHYYLAEVYIRLKSSSAHKKLARSSLKKSIVLFDEDMSRMMTANQLMAFLKRHKWNTNQRIDVDTFTPHNNDEIGFYQIHSNAARDAVGHELLPHNIEQSLIDKKEANVIFENMRLCFTDYFKDVRVSKKVTIVTEGNQEEIHYADKPTKFPSQFNYCKKQVITLFKQKLKGSSHSERRVKEAEIEPFILSANALLKYIDTLVDTIDLWNVTKDFSTQLIGKSFWEHEDFASQGARIASTLRALAGELTREELEKSLAECFSDKSKSMNLIVQRLLDKKIISSTKAYQFNALAREKLAVYCNEFILIDSCHTEQIDALPLHKMPNLAAHAQTIKSVLHTNKTITAEIFLSQTIPLSKEQVFDLFMALHQTGLVSHRLLTKIGIEIPAEMDRSYIEDIIIHLYARQQPFKLDDMQLAPDTKSAAKQLLSQLEAAKVIKMPAVYFPHMESNEDKLESLMDKIADALSEKIGQLVKDLPRLKLDEELVKQQKEEMKKKAAEKKKTHPNQTDHTSAIAGIELTPIELERMQKIRDLEALILSTIKKSIGTLRATHKVKPDLRSLDEFINNPLPPVIQEYMHTVLNNVLLFSVKPDSGFSWDAFTCAMIGVAQIVVGAMIISMCPAAALIGEALISEGIGDIIFAVNSSMNGSFSWKAYADHKVLSLAISIGTAGLGTYLGTASKATLSASEVAIKTLIQTTTQICSTLAVNAALNNIVKDLIEEIVRGFRKSFKHAALECSGSILGETKDLLTRICASHGAEAASRIFSFALQNCSMQKTIDGQVHAKIMQGVQMTSNALANFNVPKDGTSLASSLKMIGELAAKYFETKAYVDMIQNIIESPQRIFKDFNTALLSAAERLEESDLAPMNENAANELVQNNIKHLTTLVLDQIESHFIHAFTVMGTKGLNTAFSSISQSCMEAVQNKLAAQSHPQVNATPEVLTHIPSESSHELNDSHLDEDAKPNSNKIVSPKKVFSKVDKVRDVSLVNDVVATIDANMAADDHFAEMLESGMQNMFDRDIDKTPPHSTFTSDTKKTYVPLTRAEIDEALSITSQLKQFNNEMEMMKFMNGVISTPQTQIPYKPSDDGPNPFIGNPYALPIGIATTTMKGFVKMAIKENKSGIEMLKKVFHKDSRTLTKIGLMRIKGNDIIGQLELVRDLYKQVEADSATHNYLPSAVLLSSRMACNAGSTFLFGSFIATTTPFLGPAPAVISYIALTETTGGWCESLSKQLVESSKTWDLGKFNQHSPARDQFGPKF